MAGTTATKFYFNIELEEVALLQHALLEQNIAQKEVEIVQASQLQSLEEQKIQIGRLLRRSYQAKFQKTVM